MSSDMNSAIKKLYIHILKEKWHFYKRNNIWHFRDSDGKVGGGVWLEGFMGSDWNDWKRINLFDFIDCTDKR